MKTNAARILDALGIRYELRARGRVTPGWTCDAARLTMARIAHSADRMSRMITQLLDLSRAWAAASR